jgi:signal transduction histidine kinase
MATSPPIATHRMTKSASRRAAARSSDEAERFKTEFVTNVSHELRTPLNLIAGFSDLNAIYRSAQHLLALVDDVLDLARIEVGKITLACEEVDLTAVVAETADTMRDYVAAKGLELHVQIAPDLPRLWIRSAAHPPGAPQPARQRRAFY